MEQLKISRRRLLGTAAGTGVALAAPGIIGARAQSKEIVFVGFGGAYQEGQTKAFFEPFEKETGIKVVQTTGVELAKLKAQVESRNVEWDIISLPDRLRYTAVRDNLLEKLDHSRLPVADILKETVTDHGVGSITFTAQLTYSTQAFPEGKAPKSWADVWNPSAFPGKRGMYGAPTYTLEFALLADGVPKDKLYPLDVERALKSLDKIKRDAVWWTQFPQVEQMLLSREVVVSMWTRGISAQLDGKPIAVSYDGAAISYEGWVIPKGSKNFDAAMKFIAFATQPERQAALIKYVPTYGPTNRKALPMIEPRVAALLPSNPENFAKGFLFSGDWWGPNLSKVTERFNEWRLA